MEGGLKSHLNDCMKLGPALRMGTWDAWTSVLLLWPGRVSGMSARWRELSSCFGGSPGIVYRIQRFGGDSTSLLGLREQSLGPTPRGQAVLAASGLREGTPLTSAILPNTPEEPSHCSPLHRQETPPYTLSHSPLFHSLCWEQRPGADSRHHGCSTDLPPSSRATA